MRRVLSFDAPAVAMLALLLACHGQDVVRREQAPGVGHAPGWRDEPSRFKVQWVSGPQRFESETDSNLDYDSFSDATGHVREEHMAAAQAMVQDPERLERVYQDAVQGNARAARIFKELETRFFPDIGRAVARRVGGE
jgi:hypothetical protein